MANHCIYSKCFDCGGEYCERGCGYSCDCGKETEDPKIKQDEKERLEKYYRENPMPDGWF
jgi:hypothetical protein